MNIGLLVVDRENTKLEAYHKQCPCWNTVTTIVAMMIIALVIEIVSI